MEFIDVLIVEDEPTIAELHSYYLQRTHRFRATGMANSIAEARKIIKIMKPQLILLDNFLPDGNGIELLKELNTQPNPPDVIFITAATDIDTVREAVRCGVFDYLLKPIAYERMVDSLDRYLKYMSSLKASDNVSQRHVDDLFNFQAKHTHIESLPKGIDELTLNKLKALYKQSDEAYTAESLGDALGISKTTARRYLEFGVESGLLDAHIMHGKVGRPERIYHRKQ